MDIKQQILSELDSRIARIEEHADDEKDAGDNEYAKMNHALSKVIGATLKTEMEDLKDFVKNCNS